MLNSEVYHFLGFYLGAGGAVLFCFHLS